MATRSSSLPPQCDVCAGSNDWLWEQRGEYTGVRRCDCPRGRSLVVPPRPVPPEMAEPVVTANEISLAVEGLASIPWFPKEEGARTMIADALARLCASGQACFQLVRLMIDKYRQWPGPREMRICYCTLIGPPLSGDDLGTAVSDFYPDGFARPVLQVAPQRSALPAPSVSADRLLQASVRELAVAKHPKSPVVVRGPLTPEELHLFDEQRKEILRRKHREFLAAHPIQNPITQADIDKALERREKRPKGELLDGAA